MRLLLPCLDTFAYQGISQLHFQNIIENEHCSCAIMTWDCNIEHNAWLRTCDTQYKIPTDYGIIEADFNMGSKCNITKDTSTTLKAWWNEARAVDLSQTVEYQAGIEKFGLMVNAKVTGFACTYNKCASAGRIVCLYDQKLDTANNKQLYVSGTTDADKCGGCTPLQCEHYLCQPDYKLSTKTYPESLCTTQDKDEMTYDMQIATQNMVNYYRRLVASGWAKDKSDYAPAATKMAPVVMRKVSHRRPDYKGPALFSRHMTVTLSERNRKQ
ncbi:hypothetical protein Y032_0119g824 [Ancylostoma ceylanicum]|nr:hypothetical protein Y032_0119g824 [Ancylostoma ceylanicum]